MLLYNLSLLSNYKVFSLNRLSWSLKFNNKWHFVVIQESDIVPQQEIVFSEAILSILPSSLAQTVLTIAGSSTVRPVVDSCWEQDSVNTFPFCFPNAPILKSLCFFGSSQQQPFVFLIGFFRGWAATSYVQGLYSLTVEGGLRTSWLVVNYNSITTFLQRWKTWCGFAMMLMHAI